MPRDGVPFCGEFKFQFIVDFVLFLPRSLLLTWPRLQGVSHKGYVSKPPIPEEREANRLRDEAVKRRKDAARDAATRKRGRKERHEKECKIADAEGAPRPATPESTEEEDSCWYFLTLTEESASARKYYCSTSPVSIQGYRIFHGERRY